MHAFTRTEQEKTNLESFAAATVRRLRTSYMRGAGACSRNDRERALAVTRGATPPGKVCLLGAALDPHNIVLPTVSRGFSRDKILSGREGKSNVPVKLQKVTSTVTLPLNTRSYSSQTFQASFSRPPPAAVNTR